METSVLSLLAGAIFAKVALGVWLTPASFVRAHERRSTARAAVDARGGFLRRLR
jgi:hypothetical protein